MEVAIYCRVSTDEQAEHGTSLETQEERCRLYVQSLGWTIYKVYIDDGYSGKSLDRPALKRMLEDAKAGRFQVVVAYKTDRLSRRIQHIVKLVLDDFDRLHIAFRSVSEPYDTSSPAGRLFFVQLASFADFERETILERTRGGRVARVKQGRWVGGPPPYGYIVVDKRLVVDEPKAETVRRIYDLSLRGNGTHTIAETLNKAGILSPGGKSWTHSRILDILRNPVYAGRMVWGKKRTNERRVQIRKPRTEWLFAEEKSFPAIISDELFNQVQRLLDERAWRPKRSWAGSFLLTGLLVCSECGCHYQTYSATSDGKHHKQNYHAYICGGRWSGGRAACNTGSRKRELVEEPVIREVFSFVRSLQADQELQQAIRANTNRELHQIEGQMMEIKRLQDENAAARRKWLQAMEREKVIRLEAVEVRLRELEEDARTLNEKMALLEVERDQARGRQYDFDSLLEFAGRFEQLWEEASVPERKQLLKVLIERVEMGRDKIPHVFFRYDPRAISLDYVL